MNPLVRLWKNAAWELRFPLFIRPDEAFDSIVKPPALQVLARAIRLVLQKIMPQASLRQAVLTFDDGPFEGSTESLLAVLCRENVPATFFLVGDDAVANLPSTQAVVAAGMEIASHSKSHRRLTELSTTEQLDEIAQGQVLVERASGEALRFFRPPHGDFDMVTLQRTSQSGQIMSLWNVNPADYDDISAETIVERVVAQQRNPAVILLHSGRPQTIAAVPEIVRRYKQMGYSFTTIGALAGIKIG